MIAKKNTLGLHGLFWVSLIFTASVQSQQLAAPKYNVTDKHGINIHSGQATTSLDTVAIGGTLGLSHYIQSHSSNFLVRNSGGATTGVFDKFGGSARYTQLRGQNEYFLNMDPYSTYNPYDHFRETALGLHVVKVHDHEGSADFKVMRGSYAYGNIPDTSYTYFFEALGDKRHSLTTSAQYPGYLIWTKPNGTQTWFGPNASATGGGYMEKVVYPNGLTLSFTRTLGAPSVVTSVINNAGFQLKYNFLHETSIDRGIGPGLTEIPPENNATWSKQNPNSIVAINRAVEPCTSDRNTLCVGYQNNCPALDPQQGQTCIKLNNRWPTAKFSWPLGMPRAAYVGENTFSVTDSNNGVTNYRMKAFDKYAAENGTPISPSYQVGKSYVPRLAGVKPANSSAETITYNYKNYESGQNYGGYVMSMPGETGLISRVTSIKGGMTYTNGFQPSQNPDSWARQGADNLTVKLRNELLGAIISVESQDGDYIFQQDYRNFLESFAPVDGPKANYYYDARGNLNKIIYNSGLPSQTLVEASFPSTCTNAKTCNQADWTSDAKGNKTYYTYHPDSGQIAKITYPANKHGVTPQTRFTYEQKYANYYNTSGIKVQADSAIWLKTEERYCVNSNPSANGCSGNDEVVTRYEYVHDNLFLTGMTVTARNGVSLRTCYQYDSYGNRIGETQPKANLTSCN